MIQEGSEANTIISRDEARALGLKRFFTGKPCRRGHIAERSVSGGTCRECQYAYARKRWAANKNKRGRGLSKRAAAQLRKARVEKRRAAQWRAASIVQIDEHREKPNND
jgi:hypothetical protein